MAFAAAIFGLQGTEVSPEEAAFFSEINPYGYILFQRNCESPAQVKRLTDSLRDISGRDHLPILIDQEGGRVARLKPPHWPLFPSAQLFADFYTRDAKNATRACTLNARLMAHELAMIGVTVDCAPVADIPVPGAHDVIGDRAFGHRPEPVIALARAQAEGLMGGGIVPVLKHIPGHGRACADSHLELPVVETRLDTLRATDFAPFAALADLPMAMTAHVLYTALDSKRPATTSPVVIKLIRQELGFNGLLMSDDLSMKALGGDFTSRTEDALAAGCDVVLHCNGEMREMQEIIGGLTSLSGVSFARAEAAMRNRKIPVSDAREARLELEQLLTKAA
jgi:beta-N-acetylhexosaminidase